ncbi:hypothetical protein L278_07555 [Mannheimia haemolytica D35]|nr:hypothetical protein L278_07555 [Mannheimia haemolytica D35]
MQFFSMNILERYIGKTILSAIFFNPVYVDWAWGDY